MNKRALSSLALAVTLFSPSFVLAADCSSGDIGNVSECFSDTTYKPDGVIEVGDGTIEEGAKFKVIAITNRVITAVALVSVAAIVFAGFHMVTAYGDDERHKKGKDALKWGIVGFATALLSFTVVNAVINFFYNIH